MNKLHCYILLDDDPVNNMICNLMITKSMGNVDIKIFEVPEECLSYIQSEYAQEMEHTTLFLDINMPTLTGWEFIEQFDNFNETIKHQFDIYLVSSSIDQRDKDKALANKYINGFISKPLDRQTIISLAGNAKEGQFFYLRS